MEHFGQIRHIPHFYIIRSVESRLLRDYIDKKAGPLLDLGCGDGSFCADLSLNDVYGMDIDAQAVKGAEQRGCYKKVQIANALHIPFSNSFFNTVFSNCALEHMDGLKDVLKEVYRVLKNNGKFIFTVPSKYFLTVLTKDKILDKAGLNTDGAINRYNEAHHHVTILDITEWEAMLAATGFRMLKNAPYLPGVIGDFVCRMDMLYTIEVPGSKDILHKLEKRYNSLRSLLFRKKVEKYIRNPHGYSSGTHLLIMVEKI